MKNLMATAAVVGLLMTGTAYAAQTTLSDQQMDTVTAGMTCNSNNSGCSTYIAPNLGPHISGPIGCVTCWGLEGVGTPASSEGPV